MLLAGEDVEEVVGGVAPCVAFGADGCAEDDEVFGYTWKGDCQLHVGTSRGHLRKVSYWHG